MQTRLSSCFAAKDLADGFDFCRVPGNSAGSVCLDVKCLCRVEAGRGIHRSRQRSLCVCVGQRDAGCLAVMANTRVQNDCMNLAVRHELAFISATPRFIAQSCRFESQESRHLSCRPRICPYSSSGVADEP